MPRGIFSRLLTAVLGGVLVIEDHSTRAGYLRAADARTRASCDPEIRDSVRIPSLESASLGARSGRLRSTVTIDAAAVYIRLKACYCLIH